MAMSRPSNQRLGTNSLPAGPLPAGSITVTEQPRHHTSNIYTQYLNDAVQQSALETHTPSMTVSPALGLTISRFLGRDGEERDHFLEFAFNGLENYTACDDASTDPSSRFTTHACLPNHSRHAADGRVFPGKPDQPLPDLSAH